LGEISVCEEASEGQTLNAQPIVERTCWVRMCREFNNAIRGSSRRLDPTLNRHGLPCAGKKTMLRGPTRTCSSSSQETCHIDLLELSETAMPL